jgi:hypothetical protein
MARAALVAGLLGLVNHPGRAPTVIFGFLVLPILDWGATYLTSATFRGFANTLPLSLLVGSHLGRFVGAGFGI